MHPEIPILRANIPMWNLPLKEVREMDYGQILKACRERMGFSQLDMAFKLNRSQSCISKIETGRKTVDMPTFMQWIQLTNSPEVAVAMLYGLDGITIINQLLPIIGAIAIWFI